MSRVAIGVYDGYLLLATHTKFSANIHCGNIMNIMCKYLIATLTRDGVFWVVVCGSQHNYYVRLNE